MASKYTNGSKHMLNCFDYEGVLGNSSPTQRVLGTNSLRTPALYNQYSSNVVLDAGGQIVSNLGF